MWRFTLSEARWRLGFMAFFAFSSPLLFPDDPMDRLRLLSLVALLSPWLVIGREARRRARGGREAMAAAPRIGRLVLLELSLPLLLVFVTAWLNAPWRAALTLTAFCAALMTAADALDRRLGQGGEAWALLLPVSALIFSAPLWLAPWFGLPGLAPWVATYGVGLHPLAAALAASGRAALQDPYFYQWTLSGVLEARPLSWTYGAGLYALLAVAGSAIAVRAARAPRSRR